MIPKYYALVLILDAAAQETNCSLKIIAIPQNSIYNTT